MNSRPLYEIGEEVILCSKEMPEKNGDAVVLEVFDTVSGILGHYSRSAPHIPWTAAKDLNPPLYILTINSAINHAGVQVGWHESALRKKYHKGGQSFEEMMSDLTKEKV